MQSNPLESQTSIRDLSPVQMDDVLTNQLMLKMRHKKLNNHAQQGREDTRVSFRIQHFGHRVKRQF